jgi:hypothetical protein
MEHSNKNPLVLEVICAHHVPKMDIGMFYEKCTQNLYLGSESDPFVKITLCGKDKKERKGHSLATPSKQDTGTLRKLYA